MISDTASVFEKQLGQVSPTMHYIKSIKYSLLTVIVMHASYIVVKDI